MVMARPPQGEKVRHVTRGSSLSGSFHLHSPPHTHLFRCLPASNMSTKSHSLGVLLDSHDASITFTVSQTPTDEVDRGKMKCGV